MVIAALLALVFLLGDRIARTVLLEAIEKQTGFQADVGDISVGILRPYVRVRDLVLTNPPEFPHPDAVTLGELYARYHRLSLFRKEIHFDEIRIDVRRVVMVKPPHERSNLEVLGRVGEKKKADDSTTTDPSSRPGSGSPSGDPSPEDASEQEPARSIKIDRLNIKLGEVEVRQYRDTGQEPSVTMVPVNLDRTMLDVTNMQAAVRQLTSEVVVKGGIALLTPTINEAGGQSGELIEKVKGQLKQLKGLFSK